MAENKISDKKLGKSEVNRVGSGSDWRELGFDWGR